MNRRPRGTLAYLEIFAGALFVLLFLGTLVYAIAYWLDNHSPPGSLNDPLWQNVVSGSLATAIGLGLGAGSAIWLERKKKQGDERERESETWRKLSQIKHELSDEADRLRAEMTNRGDPGARFSIAKLRIEAPVVGSLGAMGGGLWSDKESLLLAIAKFLAALDFQQASWFKWQSALIESRAERPDLADQWGELTVEATDDVLNRLDEVIGEIEVVIGADG